MSQRYRLTPGAQRDVDRITDVIAEDNVEAALRVHDALEEAFRHLAEMPAMGHTREDLLVANDDPELPNSLWLKRDSKPRAGGLREALQCIC